MDASVVIKVGTNVLTRPDGRLDVTNISHLVDQIAELKATGVNLVLVSSGAVGAGRELLTVGEAFGDVARRQVLSSIGQVRLMELYRQLFAGHGLLCAQVLATKGDFRDDLHRDNMLNCFRALLHDQIVPVVNEKRRGLRNRTHVYRQRRAGGSGSPNAEVGRLGNTLQRGRSLRWASG